MKKMSLRKINKRLKWGAAVKITWGDAHGSRRMTYRWATELCEIESYGVIVAITDETVALAGFVNKNFVMDSIEEWSDKYRYIMVIPRANIVRVRRY